MTDWLLRLAGVAVLAILASELFITALTLRGSGFFTGKAAQGFWRLLVALHRRWPNHGALAFSGGLIAALTLLAWVFLLWIGWALIFASTGVGVADAATGAPADAWASIYYAGFNIFTLGLGDYRPVGPAWQFLTALSAASGLLGITLTISYLVPVLSATVTRQGLAGHMSLFGRTPQEVALTAKAEGLSAFGDRISQIGPGLLTLSRQHLAYPILHYFHTEDARLALPLRVAVLHEALLIILHGFDVDEPPPAACRATLSAIELFLEALQAEVMNSAEQAPPPPDLEPIRLAGQDVTGAIAFRTSLEPFAHQRRLLLGFVEHDGWSWEDVTGSSG